MALRATVADKQYGGGHRSKQPDAGLGAGVLQSSKLEWHRSYELLDRLIKAPAHPRAGHPQGSVPRAPGIYPFWANGKPIYVGQTRKLIGISA
jgi:hypothetical protein